MKRDFVEWLQEGILDGVISVKTAKEFYVSLYDDFTGDEFATFLFECEVDNGKL